MAAAATQEACDGFQPGVLNLSLAAAGRGYADLVRQL